MRPHRRLVTISILLLLGFSLACGEKSEEQPTAAAGASDAAAVSTVGGHDHGAPSPGSEVAAVSHYTCPMHTSVKSAEPGSCPICGMDLVPVLADEIDRGVVRLDDAQRQRIGMRMATVERRALASPLRAVGKVVVDETRLTDVSVKYGGWIERLHVDRPGQEVRRGQTLFTLYSPELLAAQQEYLSALASQRAAASTAAPERADYLVRAARQRLRLWDLSERQIDQLTATGQPVEQIPIESPASGVVLEKMVVAGSAVSPGMKLFRIAGLDRVWVEADVYEADLTRVAVGDRATVTLPYLPGRSFPGTVAFVYPFLDAATRTGRVRIELANADRQLKPDMYADVRLDEELGEVLAVPEQAVLFAGDHRYVFVDAGDGRLEPRVVETGLRTGEDIEILSGLSEGDVVVASGVFLVAAESRLKVAIEEWGQGDTP